MTSGSGTENPNDFSEPPRPRKTFKTSKEIAAEHLAKLAAHRNRPKPVPASDVEQKPIEQVGAEPDSPPSPPPLALTTEVIGVGNVSTVRERVLARRFALEMLGNGLDPAEAYRSIARLHGSKARSSRRRLPYIRPASRVVLRWLNRALPHLQQIMAEEREKAGNSYRSLHAYLVLQMTTSPATFLKHDEQGKVRFDLDQPHILPAQRGMIVAMKIRDGEISDIRTQDGMRAIDLLLRLREIERQCGATAGGDSLAKQIAKRFQAAKLLVASVRGRNPTTTSDGSNH